MASACKPLWKPPAGNHSEAIDHPKNKRGKLIGTLTQRLEGPEKVSGQAIYATDVVLAGMLWCKVLRSLFPTAAS